MEHRLHRICFQAFTKKQILFIPKRTSFQFFLYLYLLIWKHLSIRKYKSWQHGEGHRRLHSGGREQSEGQGAQLPLLGEPREGTDCGGEGEGGGSFPLNPRLKELNI